MRLRLRRKQLRRSPKEPALSLAERIVISKLDPQNFSLQATRETALQEAISATPRPTLTELIQEYRRIKAVERQLGQSMIDTVHETQDHMRRVEEFVHQPILMQGDDDIKRLEQQPPDLQHEKNLKTGKEDQTLPKIETSNNGTGDERQYRILGLYNDLKTLNVYCRSQSSVRLALSRRTMDLDMRIEWGRPLPERDSSTRQKTRKEKAWDTLKKKCLPKVQLMRALEKNSLKAEVIQTGLN
nr:hypothetical protein BaRGS_026499 [Batillaria attramentaria]